MESQPKSVQETVRTPEPDITTLPLQNYLTDVIADYGAGDMLTMSQTVKNLGPPLSGCLFSIPNAAVSRVEFDAEMRASTPHITGRTTLLFGR
ncbi:hypothetical protein QO239_27830 [Cupriavidus taiwanensis]|uniref:hypothetical protein n=1 Tax=Cupriavidus taiwanensis TaxID=164546 RepID=UPI0025414E07|nr:hypothetical protein [Cupriavidus taiwanensis]MDK3026422.1 hypothetical protein [Cupriavidus taiwanensis]